MEQLDLATPAVVTNTRWRVVRLVLDWNAQYIGIGLQGSNGEEKGHEYSGDVALTLIAQLNKINLTTTSLQKRILQRLVADGVIAGTISGAPD